MRMEELIAAVRDLEGALVLQPEPGSDAPAIAWGDCFCYYAPDGRVPERTQPYATIVTKNYPDDTASDLDPAGRWRLNIHVDRATFAELTGEDSRQLTRARDYAEADVINPHPVYGSFSWVCVVNPAERTGKLAGDLLRSAHETARRHHERRADLGLT